MAKMPEIYRFTDTRTDDPTQFQGRLDRLVQSRRHDFARDRAALALLPVLVDHPVGGGLGGCVCAQTFCLPMGTESFFFCLRVDHP